MSLNSLPNDLAQYINYEEGLARVRNNKKIYSKTLELFSETDEFDNMRRAVDDNDLDAAAHAAHSLKGMAGNLSIVKIYHLCTILQDEFEAGERNDENIAALFEAADKTQQYVLLLIQALM